MLNQTRIIGYVYDFLTVPHQSALYAITYNVKDNIANGRNMDDVATVRSDLMSERDLICRNLQQLYGNEDDFTTQHSRYRYQATVYLLAMQALRGLEVKWAYKPLVYVANDQDWMYIDGEPNTIDFTGTATILQTRMNWVLVDVLLPDQWNMMVKLNRWTVA